jgi:hypothetical protein
VTGIVSENRPKCSKNIDIFAKIPIFVEKYRYLLKNIDICGKYRYLWKNIDICGKISIFVEPSSEKLFREYFLFL